MQNRQRLTSLRCLWARFAGDGRSRAAGGGRSRAAGGGQYWRCLLEGQADRGSSFSETARMKPKVNIELWLALNARRPSNVKCREKWIWTFWTKLLAEKRLFSHRFDEMGKWELTMVRSWPFQRVCSSYLCIALVNLLVRNVTANETETVHLIRSWFEDYD